MLSLKRGQDRETAICLKITSLFIEKRVEILSFMRSWSMEVACTPRRQTGLAVVGRLIVGLFSRVRFSCPFSASEALSPGCRLIVGLFSRVRFSSLLSAPEALNRACWLIVGLFSRVRFSCPYPASEAFSREEKVGHRTFSLSPVFLPVPCV